MLKFILRLKEGSGGRLILSPGPIMKILFGIMALALLLAILVNPGEPVPVLGVILIVFAFLGIFYEETWVFDKERRTVTARTGLLFLFKKDSLAFDDIAGFFLYTSPGPAPGSEKNRDGSRLPASQPASRSGGRTGFFPAAARYVLFALELNSGKRKNIELVKTRDSSDLKQKARTIAAYCGKPLNEE